MADDSEPYQKIARKFKVSVIVAARRTLDLGLIDREQYFEFYRKYLADERRQKETRKSGGDFWNSQNVRLGKRFGAAVARAVKEGRLLHREAYRLTDLKGDSFEMMTQKVVDAARQKVSDLTVEEFRGIVREVVLDCLGEMYEDFNPDLELAPEFVAELHASVDAVEGGEPTVPWEEAKRRLEI